MDRDARNVVTSLDAFSGVNAGADREADGPKPIPSGHSAMDRTSWTIECGQEPIASRLYFNAAESAYLRTDDSIVVIQKGSPFFISLLLSGCGGIDDVGEQHCL